MLYILLVEKRGNKVDEHPSSNRVIVPQIHSVSVKHSEAIEHLLDLHSVLQHGVDFLSTAVEIRYHCNGVKSDAASRKTPLLACLSAENPSLPSLKSLIQENYDPSFIDGYRQYKSNAGAPSSQMRSSRRILSYLLSR